MDDTLRLFVAIELRDEVKAGLAAAQAGLKAQGVAVRWTDPAAAHLTLKFLGSAPASQIPAIAGALAEAARRHGPLALHTTGLGVFPHERAPRVVWLGVAGEIDKLRALQADVERFVAPLGWATERRAFSPHLTLGRSEKSATAPQLQQTGAAVAAARKPPAITWTVSAVTLMRSELLRGGAQYSAVARYSLTAPMPLL